MQARASAAEAPYRCGIARDFQRAVAAEEVAGAGCRRGKGGLRHYPRNSASTDTSASGAGRCPWPGRTRRLAFGSAAATASAASGRPGTDFASGVPDLASFPRADWLWAERESLRHALTAAFNYGDARGSEVLRQVLAGYLRRVRAAAAEPDRLVVCTGIAQGLNLVLRVLVQAGVRRVAFEDPGYGGGGATRATAARMGVETVPVPVDQHGVDVDALAASGARAVLLTPPTSGPPASCSPLGDGTRCTALAGRHTATPWPGPWRAASTRRGAPPKPTRWWRATAGTTGDAWQSWRAPRSGAEGIDRSIRITRSLLDHLVCWVQATRVVPARVLPSTPPGPGWKGAPCPTSERSASHGRAGS